MTSLKIENYSSAKRASRRDFTLHFLTPETPEQELRSAFKSKWEWVVSHRTSLSAWYSIVLGNLSRTYSELDKANIENVRDTLTKGLSKGAFERLKSVIATSGDNLCKVVRIPPRTLARRTVFKPDESERILRVAAAFQRAVEVLGDLDKARRWFSTPKRALGEKTPLEFCDTAPGAEEVMNLLGRIEHGVFS